MTAYYTQEMLDYQEAEAKQALDRLSKVLGGIQYSNMRHLGYVDVTLEQCIAELENASYGLCFSSGQGASDAIIKLLEEYKERKNIAIHN